MRRHGDFYLAGLDEFRWAKPLPRHWSSLHVGVDALEACCIFSEGEAGLGGVGTWRWFTTWNLSWDEKQCILVKVCTIVLFRCSDRKRGLGQSWRELQCSSRQVSFDPGTSISCLTPNVSLTELRGTNSIFLVHFNFRTSISQELLIFFFTMFGVSMPQEKRSN